MAAICFDDVSKVYGDGTCAVDGLDLEIQEGEFMVFVGPSGCGKTTALRMVAGLEEISSGRVVIGEREVNDVSPKDRDIAMVFQNYALYPHMTVAANLAFGLKLRQLSKQEIERRVQEAAAALDLEDYLERKPKALSGGQRQRVALGRAIVREPAAFLMDEPLSNLDAALRVQTRGEILKLQRRLGTTTIYVTHDQVEAMTMGDRIAVMRKGVLQQIGTPQELYTRPANTFVAAFIGSPAMNLVPASAIGIDRDGLLAGFRPEHLTLAAVPGGAGGGHDPGAGDRRGHSEGRVGFGFEAIVELVEYLGDERLAHVRLGERLLTAKLPADAQLATGAAVAFTVPSEAVLLFDAETGLAVDSPR